MEVVITLITGEMQEKVEIILEMEEGMEEMEHTMVVLLEEEELEDTQGMEEMEDLLVEQVEVLDLMVREEEAVEEVQLHTHQAIKDQEEVVV